MCCSDLFSGLSVRTGNRFDFMSFGLVPVTGGQLKGEKTLNSFFI